MYKLFIDNTLWLGRQGDTHGPWTSRQKGRRAQGERHTLLDALRIDSGEFAAHSSPGVVVDAIGLLFGVGANMMNVIQAEGRLVLNNGNHRALALLEHGIEYAPCVVQKVTRREELDVVAHAELTKGADYYLTAPHPPALSYFLDDDLCIDVPIPKRQRQLKVSFTVEVADVRCD